MKPKLEQIPPPEAGVPFHCFELAVPAFEFYWHYHPEFELTFIEKGRGKRLVGDSQEPFSEGDLVLLGPNLPHTWVSDRRVDGGECRAHVLQFSASVIEPLLRLPVFEKIRLLLRGAQVGLHFPDAPPESTRLFFQRLRESEGVPSYTRLLLLLDALAKTPLIVPLASSHLKPLPGADLEKRLHTVFQYVQENCSGDIQLSEVARQLHLSESAFCKFFKRTSGKTFSDYVNDARIAHACALLLETDRPIGQVAAESGFDNMAYFNRVFLKKKGMQPGKWRKGGSE